MKKWMLVPVVLILFSSVNAAEFSKASDVIQKEGQFIFTDGSSYYLFSNDGTFDSGPLGMSGRTVHGSWKQREDYQFIVEGTWGWKNGTSDGLVDKRRLIINVQPPFIKQPDDPRPQVFVIPGKVPPEIYRCYFTFEELVKVKE